MPKNAREKELARAAAKREAEKRRRRRRQVALRMLVVVALVAAVVAAGVTVFAGRKTSETRKSKSPAPSVTPSGDSSSVPSGGPSVIPASTPSPSKIVDWPCSQRPPEIIPAKKVSSGPPKMTIDVHGKYLVSMNTSCGKMQFELFPGQAPVTVNNFVYLVDKQWYDGIVFHRVAGSIDIIQAGDPLCTPPSGTDCGTGGPGYQFKDELTGKEKYTTGTVAMANSGPNTNGSQFFIVTGPKAAQLPPSYTVFGRLVGKPSLVAAKKIQSVLVQAGTDVPQAPIWILSAKVSGPR